MKCAISGSNGLIGSHLVRKFHATGIPRQVLYQPEACVEFLKGFDTVIHAAAFGNHSWQTDLPTIFAGNIFTTINLLEAARLNGVKNFIFVGSSSEYGDKTAPMTEEMLPETKTMYGCTKVCGTYLTRHYSNYLNAITLRPFSVYGEEEDDRRFIPTIIKTDREGKRLRLFGGTHDWIYVDDFVNAVAVVLKNADKLNGLVINVGTGREFTNEEVLQTMELVIGHPIQSEKVPPKPNDSRKWVCGQNKLKAFGWKPRTSLYNGLKKVYQFKTNEAQRQNPVSIQEIRIDTHRLELNLS